MKASKKPATASDNPFQTKWAVLTGARRRRAGNAAKRSHRNVFADRRIGEDDPSLPDDERYLARLQRERTRRTKKRARFSLGDDADADDAPVLDPLAGEGQEQQPKKKPFLLLRDDYDDAEDAQQEDVDDNADSDDELLTIKRPAGDDADDGDDGDTQRTHQDIMNEVVLKSKMYKAKRQEDKHVADEQTAKLDQDLPDIMALLTKSGSDFAAEEADRKRTALIKPPSSIFEEVTEVSHTEKPANPPPAPAATRDSFSYEHVYRQLAEEKRARPSDRLLTKEQKAEKELEDLRELERMRAERMENADDPDDEDGDVAAGQSRKQRAKRKGNTQKQQPKRMGGDDIDDGFDLPEEEGEDSDHLDEEEDRDNEPNQVAGNRAEGELSDDEGDGRPDPDSLVFPDLKGTKEADADIPYIFKDCPSSPAKLQILFEKRSLAQRELVLERLQTCFAISLNPTSNKAKLGQLLECILLRIESLAAVSSKHSESALAEIDMLLAHAHSLGKHNEDVVAGWARDMLASAFHKLTVSDVSKGLSSRWNVSMLLILRSIGRLFPSSDLRHPVSTPLALLLSEALALSRMDCCSDLAMGCFVSHLLIEQMTGVGRFSGQLATFVLEVLCAACGQGLGNLTNVLRDFCEDERPMDVQKLKLADCMFKGSGEEDKEYALQASIVHSALCLAEAVGMSGQIRHLDIVFEQLPLEEIPAGLSRKGLVEAVLASRRNRKALSLYTVSAAATVRRTLNPKFSAESGVFRRVAKTSYHAARSGDMSQSAVRVRRALKKEERGLARDVRHASAASRVERERELEDRRDHREKRTREAMAFLESQQANWKKAEKRQKMLSGKKW